MTVGEDVKVLIVEDDILVGEVIRSSLEIIGYSVAGYTASGQEAIELAQTLQPDVIVMDINLPDMDGLEVARYLYDRCPTPVVVLTVYDTPELIEKAGETGVGAYLIKPPHPRELQRAITLTRARFQDVMGLRRLNDKLKSEIAERKLAEKTLQQNIHELLLLNRMSQAFSSSLNLKHVLLSVMEGMRHLLNIVACSIWLVDSQTRQLVCHQAAGLTSDAVRGWRLAWGEGLAGWVVRHDQSLTVPDTRVDERHFKGVDRHISMEMRSILTIPLHTKQGVVGALQVMDTAPDRFTVTDMSLAESLAGMAAIAIENARLYAEIERQKEALHQVQQELEVRVRERTAELVQVNEALRQEIAERKLAEAAEKMHREALQQSEARFRNLFEHAPLCILEIDLARRPPLVIRANRQTEWRFGWSTGSLASAPLTRLLAEPAGHDLASIGERLSVGKTISLETTGRRCDGSLFPIRIMAAPRVVSSHSRAIVTIEDITAEKSRRSEEEAIAEERRRIAREIHDGLAQDLASLRFKVRLWYNLVEEEPERMQAELDALRQFLNEKIDEVRRSIFALRPVALDELGFYPALRQFSADFAEQYRLQIFLSVPESAGRLPPLLEPVLFRIVQEALNNVGKHAQANQVWITVNLKSRDTVVVSVRDDGAGFDPANLERAVRNGHLGLAQMRERVMGIHGKFFLQSRPGFGTEIKVELSLTGLQE